MKQNKSQTAQIRVSKSFSQRIKIAAVQNGMTMVEMADLILERGFAALKKK